MAYTTINFKTKKAVKEAIAAQETVTCFQPGLGPDLTNYSGSVSLEGPHYPQPHKWYGAGQMVDGQLVSIK